VRSSYREAELVQRRVVFDDTNMVAVLTQAQHIAWVFLLHVGSAHSNELVYRASCHAMPLRAMPCRTSSIRKRNKKLSFSTQYRSFHCEPSSVSFL